jgi:simple sugar transport system permease protein
VNRIRKSLAVLTAPALAIAFSLLLTTIILAIFGANIVEVFSRMYNYGTSTRSLTLITNTATTYYLSAVAVAIGFKMNLFNIGVNGQYRLAAMSAGAVAGWVALPGPLAIMAAIFVAMFVGALWAGIAAWLKVVRGVSEIISTIMLNFIAIGVISYVIVQTNIGTEVNVNVRGTPEIPENARLAGLNLIDPKVKVYGFFFIAIIVGILYWTVLNRTRFGYDLRASGLSSSAAKASGVNSNRMIVYTMLASGAIAGLVGLPDLLGKEFSYNLNFPANYGFTGIAIALLGRNHPVGIAFGALLWAFLDVSSQILDLDGVPREIVTIMQGVTVLSVVVAYELVRRNRVKSQQQNVGKALAGDQKIDAAKIKEGGK